MQHEWISVKERLPKIEDLVIFYAKGATTYCVCIGYIIPPENRRIILNRKTIFWFVGMSENEGFSEDMVTHWMPLPSPPKENEG